MASSPLDGTPVRAAAPHDPGTFLFGAFELPAVMADIRSTTVNEEEFFASSRVGNFELSIDATGEDGPTPNEVLVADYASCYTFAFRAGAQREHDLSLGPIQTEAVAELDENDDLASISLTLHVEDDLTDEQVESLTALGEEICHIHSAVGEELRADIEVVPGATVEGF